MVILRVRGFEVSILLGKYPHFFGYHVASEGIAVGLGFARIIIRPLSPEETTPPRPAPVFGNECPVCDEPVLGDERSFELPAASILRSLLPGRFLRPVHAECLILAQHGRVGCQRNECPKCEPPPGQSVRQQARDAEAFFKASNGRRNKKKGAVS